MKYGRHCAFIVLQTKTPHYKIKEKLSPSLNVVRTEPSKSQIPAEIEFIYKQGHIL